MYLLCVAAGVVVIDEYGQVQRFVEKPKVRTQPGQTLSSGSGSHARPAVAGQMRTQLGQTLSSSSGSSPGAVAAASCGSARCSRQRASHISFTSGRQQHPQGIYSMLQQQTVYNTYTCSSPLGMTTQRHTYGAQASSAAVRISSSIRFHRSCRCGCDW